MKRMQFVWCFHNAQLAISSNDRVHTTGYGIGAEIAKGLAAAGASVVVNYASSKEGADRVVSEIAERGGTAFAAQGDVSKSGDVKQLFTHVVREFGGLDVLVMLGIARNTSSRPNKTETNRSAVE
jgi:NAD(P)-dependent dehydrogenase (short-subunit alcohol dehydrogenase family)